MNKQKDLMQPLNDLVAEYEGLWVARNNLSTFPLSDFEVESIKNITPGILLGRLKNYLSDTTLNIEGKVNKISDYLIYNGTALETMSQTYKEAKPFLVALRKIMHFFVALFTGKPLKNVVNKSESTILIWKLHTKCNEIRRAALVQKTDDTPTLTVRMG